jgi:hypothetical protein
VPIGQSLLENGVNRNVHLTPPLVDRRIKEVTELLELRGERAGRGRRVVGRNGVLGRKFREGTRVGAAGEAMSRALADAPAVIVDEENFAIVVGQVQHDAAGIRDGGAEAFAVAGDAVETTRRESERWQRASRVRRA